MSLLALVVNGPCFQSRGLANEKRLQEEMDNLASERDRLAQALAEANKQVEDTKAAAREVSGKKPDKDEWSVVGRLALTEAQVITLVLVNSTYTPELVFQCGPGERSAALCC